MTRPPTARPERARRLRRPPARTATDDFSDLARALGERVRSARSAGARTVAQLAAAAGLSRRFLTDVELGKANVSLQGLARIAAALRLPLAVLLDAPAGAGAAAGAEAVERARLVLLAQQVPVHALRDGVARLTELTARRPPLPRVALIGLRGAGKSSLGRAVAQRCGLAFVELDQEVEAAAGMPLADLFTLHGEAYYRRLERDALQRVIDTPRGVVAAAGGGIVAAPETYELLRRHFTTIWLRASPEDHWNRVVAQGDHRPMQGQPAAMARLREILAERAPLYGLAHHVIETSALGETGSARALEALVRATAPMGAGR